jgi:hypothetical protein
MRHLLEVTADRPWRAGMLVDGALQRRACGVSPAAHVPARPAGHQAVVVGFGQGDVRSLGAGLRRTVMVAPDRDLR